MARTARLQSDLRSVGITLGPTSPPKSAPVKIFAFLGVASVLTASTAWIRWMSSPNFKRTPPGPDSFEGAQRVALHVTEIAWFAAGVFVVWRFIVRPLIQRRGIGFDGKLTIAAFFAWFLDPLDNYFVHSFLYNAHTFQRGSWVTWIPGWSSANAETFVEPIAMIFGGYMLWFVVLPLLTCALIRWGRSRFPTASWATIMAGVFAVVAVIDTLFELAFIRGAQAFVYAGIPEGWALFPGKYYQFPIYEGVFVAVFATGLGAFRYFRDDRGRSVAERGLDQLRVSDRMKGVIGGLAVIGFVYVVFLFGYFVPYNAMALRSDTFPALPSYFRQGICGEGTDYACPSKYVPIPQRASLHVGPDDPRLPKEVRERQGVRHYNR